MTRILLALLLLAAPMLAAAQNDLALDRPFGEILSPQSGVELSSNENVSVRLVNTGTTLPGGTTFNLSYRINGSPPVTEMVVLGSSLLGDSAFQYTFVTQVNLSTGGSYNVLASVALPGDINPTNDQVDVTVTNTLPSLGGTLERIGDQLTLSGQRGSVRRWERSRDHGVTWEMLANTTPTQAFNGADHRELFRAIVANFTAPEAASSIYDSAAP